MDLITVDIKKAFFDLKKINDAIEREQAKSLAKGAASVRRTQIKSIKFGKGPSQPGRPPHRHSRRRFASPQNILYGYDRSRQAALVGMVRIPQSTVTQSTPLPEALEKGGTITVKRRGKKGRRIRIRKRPSAMPAFMTEIRSNNIAKHWSGVIK